RVMIHQFTQQWSPEWQARLDSLHFSRHELVALASIVEAEVRYDPDRPFVSAVYHNRLKRGMRLEADPTVSYAYGRRLRRVWEKNLAVRSPYNTYLHAGLPPGPIGQPGRAGLVAAPYPADVPSRYFGAQPDGKHTLSATYAEPLSPIQRSMQFKPPARAPAPPRPVSRPRDRAGSRPARGGEAGRGAGPPAPGALRPRRPRAPRPPGRSRSPAPRARRRAPGPAPGPPRVAHLSAVPGSWWRPARLPRPGGRSRPDRAP